MTGRPLEHIQSAPWPNATPLDLPAPVRNDRRTVAVIGRYQEGAPLVLVGDPQPVVGGLQPIGARHGRLKRKLEARDHSDYSGVRAWMARRPSRRTSSLISGAPRSWAENQRCSLCSAGDRRGWPPMACPK